MSPAAKEGRKKIRSPALSVDRYKGGLWSKGRGSIRVGSTIVTSISAEVRKEKKVVIRGGGKRAQITLSRLNQSARNVDLRSTSYGPNNTFCRGGFQEMGDTCWGGDSGEKGADYWINPPES